MKLTAEVCKDEKFGNLFGTTKYQPMWIKLLVVLNFHEPFQPQKINDWKLIINYKQIAKSFLFNINMPKNYNYRSRSNVCRRLEVDRWMRVIACTDILKTF